MPARRGPISEADYTVEDRGYETPCHIWRGPFFSNGYGRFGRDYRGVHLIVFTEEHGRPGKGLVVHHRCEQRACMRLDHLEAVTRTGHPPLHRKYGPEQVEEIRRATGTTRQIAHRFGISKSHAAVLRRPS